ncbi:sigma-70 family RNA polymerase sigma factor [Tamlana fucoidanivorans]|uniref:Sigma-70 family RNA polymerase sigma factor n=1 Tax=Allotamlana fucoidanivorans TaxID=2583814 RepID=A0A5C4SMF4_9FLAO|nr:sigma-70 family RNA polymerase sigma factor [Tamlana fucoidanivorans]TNJ44928.1 sigma-70 family RNA polymerase sigma factor [Tamlana fucoidanivorans]
MTLTNLNIEQLITLCKTNNQTAQMEVYNRYYKAMYNTTLRIVKDHFEAEDIMQEAFLIAFTKLDSLNDASIFGSWLKRIVVNKSIEYYNKKVKNGDISIHDMLYKIEDQSDSFNVDEPSSNNNKVNQILNLIKTLKDNYRISLTLNLIEGYDYEEISEIMNISYANSRTMISRAKESLRMKLEKVITY